MQTTPNYNLPYAEGTDARRDFPAVVDAPRTTAIDTELARVDQELTDTGVAGKAILHGTAQTDGTGTIVLTFPAGTFASTPTVLLTVVEKTNITIRARGGGTATSITVNTFSAPTSAASPDVYFFWLAIGPRP